jgi:hypothetical protein
MVYLAHYPGQSRGWGPGTLGLVEVPVRWSMSFLYGLQVLKALCGFSEEQNSSYDYVKGNLDMNGESTNGSQVATRDFERKTCQCLGVEMERLATQVAEWLHAS